MSASTIANTFVFLVIGGMCGFGAVAAFLEADSINFVGGLLLAGVTAAYVGLAVNEVRRDLQNRRPRCGFEVVMEQPASEEKKPT